MALVGAAAPLTQWPAGAESLGQGPAQAASGRLGRGRGRWSRGTGAARARSGQRTRRCAAICSGLHSRLSLSWTSAFSSGSAASFTRRGRRNRSRDRWWARSASYTPLSCGRLLRRNSRLTVDGARPSTLGYLTDTQAASARSVAIRWRSSSDRYRPNGCLREERRAVRRSPSATGSQSSCRSRAACTPRPCPPPPPADASTRPQDPACASCPASPSTPHHDQECCDKREKAPERSGLVAPCRTLGPAALLCRRWRARRARCAATGRARRWMPSATGVFQGHPASTPSIPPCGRTGPTCPRRLEVDLATLWGAPGRGASAGPQRAEVAGLLCAGLGRVCSGQGKAPNGRTTCQGWSATAAWERYGANTDPSVRSADCCTADLRGACRGEQVPARVGCKYAHGCSHNQAQRLVAESRAVSSAGHRRTRPSHRAGRRRDRRRSCRSWPASAGRRHRSGPAPLYASAVGVQNRQMPW